MSAPVFLMQHLGVSETGFLWLFGPAMGGLMSGSWLPGRAGRKADTAPDRLARLSGDGYWAALLNIMLNLFFPPALPWSIIPIRGHLRHVSGHALSDPDGARAFPAAAGLAASFVRCSCRPA